MRKILQERECKLKVCSCHFFKSIYLNWKDRRKRTKKFSFVPPALRVVAVSSIYYLFLTSLFSRSLSLLRCV